MSTPPESVPPHEQDIPLPTSGQPEQSQDAPRGGEHPEQPTGGTGGQTVPEGDRSTYGTSSGASADALPDEPLPPQD